MRCIAVITHKNVYQGGTEPGERLQFDSRPAALNKMREMAASEEQFSFELYEQVLVGSTVCQLETSPPREVSQAVSEVPA